MARKHYIENRTTDPRTAYWNDNEVISGWNLITDRDTKKYLHGKRYAEAERAGINYFHKFQAELYLRITEGTPISEVLTLEGYVDKLVNELRSGSWLTAQGTNQALAISGLYDQTMKDEIQSDIDSYIVVNY